MLNRLPEIIEPLHLADKRGELKGQIPVSSLQRIAELLFDDSGLVTVELFFGREGRLPKIEGHIQAVLQLKCQSCLQAVEWSVDSTVKLGIVSSIDQANRLPDDYEPLLVEQDSMLLRDVIEDELLLSLPAYPKHEHSCFVSNLNDKTTPAHDTPSSRENPFSILAKLKNTGEL